MKPHFLIICLALFLPPGTAAARDLHSTEAQELLEETDTPDLEKSQPEQVALDPGPTQNRPQERIDELSKSKDPKDWVSAAQLLGKDNPKSKALLDKAWKAADEETLKLILEQFADYYPEVEGLAPDKLKFLAQWGLEKDAQLLFRSAVEELLAQSVSPKEILPLVERGLERSPGATLLVLDSLKPEDAKKFDSVAALAMSKMLEGFEYMPGKDFLKNFPKTIEANAPAIEKQLGVLGGKSKAMELLGATQNPKYLESYMAQINDSRGLNSLAASEALGRLLSAKPELATPAVEERLRTILEAKDERDIARLHLRQHLPESLMHKLDQQIFENQERDPERAAAVLTKTTQAALEILKKEGIGLMGPGQRGLAIEFLIRSGHQDAPRLVEEYLKTAFPKGYIHNVNSIQGVIQAANQAGISIDPEVLKKAQTRVEREARGLWNSGNPEMRERSQGSNLIPFGGAAYIASAADPSQLNPTQKEILEALRKMRGQPMPYFFPTKDEPKESGALLDKAPTSGRAVTAGLATYLTASSDEKPEAAKELLGATRTYLQHFSQTHEIPRASNRTHDRTPGGQQMAAYYGFANDPQAMQALVQLSREPSLSQAQRQEASQMASQLQARLLTLTEKDGTVYRRKEESFANENLVYQILTGLAVVQGAQAQPPRQRLLQQVP